jgi:dGTPase
MAFTLAKLARSEHRYQRRHADGSSDQRNAPQRDRDRILYTSALRRLANVTQVAGGFEGHVFHNRLTHTLEVAQIARRLAEKLRDENRPLARRLGGIDPDVVEAAALAHDLGHPPFGHIAEKELDRLAREADQESDGFEGNAQSFRILTKISAHRSGYSGLNLTRATMNAVLKYPWDRVMDPRDKQFRKFSTYRSEAADFEFARGGYGDAKHQSVEASIMDVADDIAYSVHDLDDFYRAGLIPVFNLRKDDEEFRGFLERWRLSGKLSAQQLTLLDVQSSALRRRLEFLFPSAPYTGTDQQRKLLRRATSSLIGQFVRSVTLLQEPSAQGMLAEAEPNKDLEIRFLQRLVWHYVIDNPRLATQQEGQRAIIRTLFTTYHTAIIERRVELIPPRYRAPVDALIEAKLPQKEENAGAVRIAVDIVAQFTDVQAVAMYRRITGISPGSVIDLVHT